MNIIGIGTDITEIVRIERMLEKHPERFSAGVYTESELRYSNSKSHRSEHLAGRWAAKEAVLKAIGTGWIGGITWKDVEVTNNSAGKPSIVLTGGAKKVADSLGISEVQISISHGKEYAIAFAIAIGSGDALLS